MKLRKKLIEVSLPLEAINRASAREKSIRHGYPSTLHLWWARRPLAACRAVLFAQLVDNPSAWPDEFPTEEDQARERARLHRLIAETVPREATNDKRILNKARHEIARSLSPAVGARRRRRARTRRGCWVGSPTMRHQSAIRSAVAARSRWRHSASACALMARTSTRSRRWSPRRPARSRPIRPGCRRSIRTATRMWRERARKGSPRTSVPTRSSPT